MKRADLNKRHAKWKKQRKQRGFDDRELWNLDTAIAEFVAPRLRAFATMTNSYPDSIAASMDVWRAKINEMADAFEWLAGKRSSFDNPTKEVTRGLELFAKQITNLWD